MATLFPFLPPHLAPMDFLPLLVSRDCLPVPLSSSFCGRKEEGRNSSSLGEESPPFFLRRPFSSILFYFSVVRTARSWQAKCLPSLPPPPFLDRSGLFPPPPLPRSLTQTASALIGPVFFHLVTSPSLSVHPRCHCCSGEEARSERGMPFQCQRSTLETVPTSPSERVDFGNKKTFPPPPLPLRRATMQRYATAGKKRQKGERGGTRQTNFRPKSLLPSPLLLLGQMELRRIPQEEEGEKKEKGRGGAQKSLCLFADERPGEPWRKSGFLSGPLLYTFYIVLYGEQSPQQTTGSSSPPR